MRRRTLLGGVSGALGTKLAFAQASGSAEGGEAPVDFYELRTYHVRIGEQKTALDGHLRDAALPAWNRLGIRPVGVFETMVGPEIPKVHLLLTHPGVESVATLAGRLETDDEYKKAAADWLGRPASAPPYDRFETSLLRAFPNVPHVEVPEAARTGKPRIFELRTYEGHSEAAHSKKMDMFTKMGELEIFRRAGLVPVFFGKTLVGRRLPNFVYMLTYADLLAREQAWRSFGGDPEWKTLAKTPGYTDPEILSNLTSLLLRPAAFSQI